MNRRGAFVRRATSVALVLTLVLALVQVLVLVQAVGALADGVRRAPAGSAEQPLLVPVGSAGVPSPAPVGSVDEPCLVPVGSVGVPPLALVVSVEEPLPAPAVVTPTYRWPLAGEPTVTRPFQPPAQRWLPGHRGVDLAGGPGQVVHAAGAGVVFFAGTVAGRGVVSIDHAGGLRTTYEPVTALLSAGEPVSAGDPIGVLDPGHAGCPQPACLHWGLRSGEHYLDPLIVLGWGRVRLLPRAAGSAP